MPLTSDPLVSTKLRPSQARPEAGGEAAPGREAGSGARSQADARLRACGLRQDHASESSGQEAELVGIAP